MKADHKGAGQRAGEQKVNIGPAIVRHVALLNDAFFLQLLMREFVGAQDLLLLLLAGFAFRLAPHVV